MRTPFPFWAIAAIVVGVLVMVAVSVIIMALIYFWRNGGKRADMFMCSPIFALHGLSPSNSSYILKETYYSHYSVMYICTFVCGLMGQTWPAVIATGPKKKFNSIHIVIQKPR